MSFVIAFSSLVDTFDSTWIWAACPATPFGPGTGGLAEFAHLRHRRDLGQVGHQGAVSQVWSAALNDPVLTAATTGTGTVDVENPSGAARFAACSLGALAGRKALLLPCVTLASEGSAFGMATAATIQRTTIYPAELDGELTNTPENVIGVHAPNNSGPALGALHRLSRFSAVPR